MRRVSPVLPAALLLLLLATLLTFGTLADRALVGQARAAFEAARDGAGETRRLTALSVRATLAQVEQAVVAGRPVNGVATERLAIAPSRLPTRGVSSYGSRTRAELVKLLDSTLATPSGLPEAVVARLALGDAPSAGAADDVAARLLSGRLPVFPEDLPHLARALGLGDDPRVAVLQERLRRAPSADSLPGLPSFRRAFTERGSVEGWSRGSGERLRYEVGAGQLLALAGVSERATVARAAIPAGPSSESIVAVPEVAGMLLAVTVEPPGALRLQLLRGALWAAVLSSCLGLAAVRRALDREARANAREKRFLAGVSHELRTPLAAIRLFGETLAEGRGDPRDYGRLVARESERLETLVERVLSVTRVDEAVSLAPTRPRDVVSSALELVAPRAERRSVTIRCDLDGAGDLESIWDADAVRRALLNLLDNAVTHGRERGHVDVGLAGDAATVRIAVKDDGPGIGKRHQAGLFGRFFRGESGAPGTGLGLYLVDQVARAHGGRVDLVTEEGKGATFTLVLPRNPVET